MPYAAGVQCDPHKSCPPGTREGFVGDVINWVNATDDESGKTNIMWLAGAPQSGKTTVVNSVFHHFNELNRAASFCVDGHNSWELFPTLSRDLADMDPGWKGGLHRSVHQSKATRTTHSLVQQAKHFIVEPAKHLAMRGPVLLVIDGLETLEDGRPESRTDILELLSNRLACLPHNIRILVSSRIESDIYEYLVGKRFRASVAGPAA